MSDKITVRKILINGHVDSIELTPPIRSFGARPLEFESFSVVTDDKQVVAVPRGGQIKIGETE